MIRKCSSITARYSLGMVALTLVGIMFWGGIYYWHQGEILEEGLREKGRAMASTLASSIALPMLKEDYSAIGPLIYAALQQKDIAYGIVRDLEGTVISQKGETLAPEPLLIEKMPIEYFQTPLGEVEIGLYAAPLAHQRRSTLIETGLVGLGSALGAILVAYLLAAQVTRPLKRLTATARQMQEGNLEVRVPEEGEREMVELAAAFNQMAGAIQAHRRESEEKVRERTRELAEKIKTIGVKAEIDRAMLSTLSQEEIIQTALQYIRRLIPGEWTAIALMDQEEAQGFEVLACITDKPQPYEEKQVPFDQTLFSEVARKKAPLLVPELAQGGMLSQYDPLIGREGVKSVMALPLQVRGEVIGIMAFGSEACGCYHEGMIPQAQELANQMAIALDNAGAYKSLQEAFFGTIGALAKALDARDTYTGGHSERVMAMAQALAQEIGLPPWEVELIKFAGLLHDIGKIGIEETILHKPGCLEEKEYEGMKRHPVIGAEILAAMKNFRDIMPLVKHHHERYDGQGYPAGLKGESIPLGSRILSIADAVEAMNSNRPYRQGLSPEVIKRELAAHAGTQFDPHLVSVFMGIVDDFLLKPPKAS